MSGTGSDPEETAPFRSGAWTTPSGEPVDLTKASPPPPPPSEPPTAAYPSGPGQPQFGAPVPQAQPAYPPGYPPGYGYAPMPYVYVNRSHGQATSSMWLGITGIAGAVLTPFCCITLPLLVCSPIAWGLGVSARKAIRSAPPGTFTNEGQAQAGLVLGIIGSVLGVLAIVGVLLLFGFAYSI